MSEVTVRKDVAILSQHKLINREHGFVTSLKSEDLEARLSVDYDNKRRIAERAAQDVNSGEIIMVESGACNVLLAERVAETKRNVTIVTNSVFVASFLRQKKAKVLLLGGELQKESQLIVGPLVKRCLEEFFVTKFFVGAEGVMETGFLTSNMDRADTAKLMREHASKTYVLAESELLQTNGGVFLFPFSAVGAVYTDEPNDGLEKKLADVGADLIVC